MPYVGRNDANFRLGLIADRINNPRAVLLGPVTDEIRSMFRTIFLSQGAALGRPWAPLKPSTLYRKLVRGQGFGHTLRATDALFTSLTERGAPGSYARLSSARTVEVGTTIAYGRYHQTGTRHMPRRPYVPDDTNVPPATVRNLLKLVKHHLTFGDDD